jgi:cephalosporin hydroxylase
MVVLDSDHSTKHVAAELEAWKDIVTKDQYLVVEDCWTYREGPYHPYKAVKDFLKANPNFKRYNIEKQFVFAVTRDGWLRKIA